MLNYILINRVGLLGATVRMKDMLKGKEILIIIFEGVVGLRRKERLILTPFGSALL